MQAWWRDLSRNYKYQPHELFVLKMCCEAHDEAEAARLFLARNGRTYADANGVTRKRPEVSIEQSARAFFLRSVRQLGLLRTERPKSSDRSSTLGVGYWQL